MCLEHNVPSGGGSTISPLIRTLARAHRWKPLLEEGRYGSAAEIAGAQKIGCSFVSLLPALTSSTRETGSRLVIAEDKLLRFHS